MSQPAEPERVMQVYLTNAVRTSQGPGPGAKTLPISEANALIGMKYAIAGDQPPRDVMPEPADKRFGSPPARRPAQSN